MNDAWLLTLSCLASGSSTTRVVENVVTIQTPLRYLCALMAKWPEAEYLLLSAVPVPKDAVACWCIAENGGSPHGNALDVKMGGSGGE